VKESECGIHEETEQVPTEKQGMLVGVEGEIAAIQEDVRYLAIILARFWLKYKDGSTDTDRLVIAIFQRFRLNKSRILVDKLGCHGTRNTVV
jgi:hypothetical protein